MECQHLNYETIENHSIMCTDCFEVIGYEVLPKEYIDFS